MFTMTLHKHIQPVYNQHAAQVNLHTVNMDLTTRAAYKPQQTGKYSVNV